MTFTVDITIQQKGSGGFTVDFGRAGDLGTSGTVRGQQFSFTRRYSDFAGNHVQHWTGRLTSNSSFSGSNDNNVWPVGCTFSATKK